MKTKEELNAIKEEVETVSKKLAELSEDELKLVAGGGFDIPLDPAIVKRLQLADSGEIIDWEQLIEG